MSDSTATTITNLVNLADERLGAGPVARTDQSFGPVAALLRPQPAAPGGPDADCWHTVEDPVQHSQWCVIRLGVAGVARGVVVDTRCPAEDIPEMCWVDGCALDGYPSAEEVVSSDVEWMQIAGRHLKPGAENVMPSTCDRVITHVRVQVEPHGAVGRLRVHGVALPDPRDFAGLPVDLAAAENGARVELSSDMPDDPSADGPHRPAGDTDGAVPPSSHYELVMPGPPRSAYETWRGRRPAKGFDWAVVRLAAEGVVRMAEVDTHHAGVSAPVELSLDFTTRDDSQWRPLVGPVPLQPETRHRMPVAPHPPANRVRVNVFPHGGLGRLRLFGTLSERGVEDMAQRRFNALPDAQAERELLKICGSRRWAAEMAAWRPFTGLDQTRELAVKVWRELSREDWAEALHERPSVEGQALLAWRPADGSVDPSVLEILVKAHRVYEHRFGYAFLADPATEDVPSMLDRIRSRLGNDPQRELSTAAEEQLELVLARLTHLIRPEQVRQPYPIGRGRPAPWADAAWEESQ